MTTESFDNPALLARIERLRAALDDGPGPAAGLDGGPGPDPSMEPDERPGRDEPPGTGEP